MLSATLRKAASKFFGQPRRRPIRNRFRLQSLEGRDVPSSYFGTGPGDDGAGIQESLRQNSANTPAGTNHVDSLIKLENHVETSSSLKIEAANSKGAADAGSGKNQMDAGDRTSKGDTRGIQVAGQFEAKTMTQLKSSYDVDLQAGKGGRSIEISRDFEMTTTNQLKSSFDADIGTRHGSVKIDSGFELTTTTQIKSSYDVDISGHKGNGSIQFSSNFEMLTMTQLKSSFDAEIDSRRGGSSTISREFEMTTQTQLKSSFDVEMQRRHGGGSIQFSSNFEMLTMTQIKSSFDAEMNGRHGGAKISREFEATTMTQLKSSFDADLNLRHGGQRIRIAGQIESTLMSHFQSTFAALGNHQNGDRHERDFLGLGRAGQDTALLDYFASQTELNAGFDFDSREAGERGRDNSRGRDAIKLNA